MSNIEFGSVDPGPKETIKLNVKREGPSQVDALRAATAADWERYRTAKDETSSPKSGAHSQQDNPGKCGPTAMDILRDYRKTEWDKREALAAAGDPEELARRVKEREEASVFGNQKMWVATALSPYDNPYGSITVMAATREGAIAKARRVLSQDHSYVPYQKYADNMLENLTATITEVTDGVFVDWDRVRRR